MWWTSVLLFASGLALSLTEEVNYRLYPTELQLPKLGLGAAALGNKAVETILAALAYGVRLIDTAQATEWYSETDVGLALQRYSALSDESIFDQVILVTKIHPRSFEFSKMTQKLHESEKKLQRKNIDVVLLHAPYCWRGHCTPEEEAVSWTTGWQNLQILQKLFAIRAIGVSNFDLSLLKQVVSMPTNMKPESDDPSHSHIYHSVSIIQNWMDPFHQDQEVRAFAKLHNIQYMAYSSFGTQWHGENPVLTSSVLQAIAAKHNATITQVVLSWLIEHEGVTAIPRATSPQHLKENFDSVMPKRYLLSATPATTSIATVEEADGDSEMEHSSIYLDEEDLEQIRALDGTLGLPWD